MNTREYRNVPGAGKKKMVRDIPYSIFYSLFVYIAYLIDPENVTFILVFIGLGVWITLKEIGESFRIVSLPVCRLTDEFVVSDYDRNVVVWESVVRIVTNARKRTVDIYHSTGKSPITHEPSQDYARIKGKWMQDWDSFLRDLEDECEKRSITFTAKP